ncbi:MAG: helix-turn-helix transcriptional regulator, partial [Fibrobacteres bacterium]|nr:helix-turn-helix transcriptional regulator [Fibrobacterota bacterium]
HKESVRLSITSSGRMLSSSSSGIPTRTINDHLMYYIAAGTMTSIVNDKKVILPPDSFFWLQPGEKHSIMRDIKGNTTEHIFCRFYMGTNEAIRLSEPYMLIPEVTGLRRPLLELTPEKRLTGEIEEEALRYAFGTLFCHIQAHIAGSSQTAGGLSYHQKRVALDYLRNNLTRRFTITEWANELSLNADYFSRQFNKSFNEPPFSYIKRARIERASLLLMESDLTVSAIAESLGYESLYFFSRQFREVTGKSPRQYKQTLRAS